MYWPEAQWFRDKVLICLKQNVWERVTPAGCGGENDNPGPKGGEMKIFLNKIHLILKFHSYFNIGNTLTQSQVYLSETPTCRISGSRACLLLILTGYQCHSHLRAYQNSMKQEWCPTSGNVNWYQTHSTLLFWKTADGISKCFNVYVSCEGSQALFR